MAGTKACKTPKAAAKGGSKKKRGCVENLKPVRTHEEAVELGRRGGQAYARNVAKRKATKQALETILSMPLKKGMSVDLEELASLSEAAGKNLTAGEAIAAKMVKMALAGDTKAMRMLYSLVGELDSHGNAARQQEEVQDDGFLEALNASAADDWKDGDDDA